MLEECRKVPIDEPVDQDLMTLVFLTLFTFIPFDSVSKLSLAASNFYEFDFRYLETVMSSLSCINASFLKADVFLCDQQYHNVDLEKAAECFNVISKIEHPSILDTVCTFAQNFLLQMR